jgi:ubiquinone/menaquinone biosynthesis C-methylase UbiE
MAEADMADELETAVARHYGLPGLAQQIESALAAAGLGADRIAPEALAPIDEFHIGGRAATAHVVGKMGLTPATHVLDVGCGLGGAARFIAGTYGCRATGIDLTPDYVVVARLLAARTGLADRTDYQVASALDVPFADATFDAALTLHVAMNIGDRPALYAEVARVLKPNATFCVYDVMQGPNDGLRYPVPWAETPAVSHLRTPEETRSLLLEAGFTVGEVEDRTAAGIAFFRERLAKSGPMPPLGLHVLMGAQARDKFANMLTGLEAGCIAPVVIVARRAA